MSLGVFCLGVFRLGATAGVLDVGGPRLTAGQEGKGGQQKDQLAGAGVSVGHDSYQTPPKSLSFAG